MIITHGHNKIVYTFGEVVVDLENFHLLRGGHEIKLGSRSFDLLVYLIENRGRLVEKDELFEHVWRQAIVTDSALTQEIRQIRRAIGDDAGAPRYIQTVPKHGYRFIAEVSEIAPDAVDATLEPTWNFNSLAVLPFDNLNKDTEQDYFVEGMTDLLITDLGKIKSLKVISRTSTMQYKDSRKSLPQIGQELKVRAVVEGAVLRVGKRVRITVQLIDAATDQHVWAESYERGIRDVMDLQNEVARTVAEKIRVRLTPDEKSRVGSTRSVNPEAYDAYLRGNFFLLRFTPDSPYRAIELFQHAIDIEPEYAAAYVGIAEAYGHIGWQGLAPQSDVDDKIWSVAMKALQIDPKLGEAHRILAKCKMYSEYDRPAAIEEFKQALSLNPNDMDSFTHYALCLITMGRLDEARPLMARALELAPFSVPLRSVMGFQSFVAGRRIEAIEQLRETLEMDPGFFLGHWFLWRFCSAMEMYEEALNEFCQIPMLFDGEVVNAAKEVFAASGYQKAMRRAADMMVLRSSQRYVLPTQIAMLYAHAGENDLAMDWLDRAFEERDQRLIAVGVEPDWEHLRPFPRFQQLLRRIK